MNINFNQHGDTKVLEVSGEIDMYTSPGLRQELMALVRKKATPIVVCLRDVSYIDSSGIATFVEALKDMIAYKGALKLVDLSERVKEIFTFSKLDKVFDICDTLDDALGQ